ncbi:MAG: hypothetical protein K0R08_1844 [Solimicrobium sp.]|jgi:hypothetical protein|nr:hypothetical protein [Solimicrobium sp.]
MEGSRPLGTAITVKNTPLEKIHDFEKRRSNVLANVNKELTNANRALTKAYAAVFCECYSEEFTLLSDSESSEQTTLSSMRCEVWSCIDKVHSKIATVKELIASAERVCSGEQLDTLVVALDEAISAVNTKIGIVEKKEFRVSLFEKTAKWIRIGTDIYIREVLQAGLNEELNEKPAELFLVIGVLKDQLPIIQEASIDQLSDCYTAFCLQTSNLNDLISAVRLITRGGAASEISVARWNNHIDRTVQESSIEHQELYSIIDGLKEKFASQAPTEEDIDKINALINDNMAKLKSEAGLNIGNISLNFSDGVDRFSYVEFDSSEKNEWCLFRQAKAITTLLHPTQRQV